ncbi:MAG TPA: 3-hydroxyacyl-CoA dehydrogenase NAD-binding domain-containing protein, partial [Microlunatus sp.]|nr:3-hydroxyacyl-CoA dehydrogenase NAD-binding domain-containing protein [Microlunatus sp.]
MNAAAQSDGMADVMEPTMGAMSKDELAALIDELSQLSADEVVTQSLSRDVALPHGAGTAVLITLANGFDHSRPNTLGPRGLGALNRAIDAALGRDDIVAIMITGKPFILAAGADLSGVPKITHIDQARALARIGHAVFDKLHTASVPTFALINGLALGGGLELALHCRYRTVSTAAAGIALPECFLGMFPGWGGAYLLPNLIGADRAVTVIIENPLNNNTMLDGRAAFALGIADALFEGADFLERSADWAAQVITGSITVDRPAIDRGTAWDAAVRRGRGIADARVSGASPGPYAALDLITAARTTDRLSAYAAEDDALARVLMSPQLRAGLYAFDLVQKRARRPAGAPDRNLARPVSTVGIVGAGLMASQLALLFARRLQVPVMITDLDQQRVDKGLAYVQGEVDKLLAKKRISPAQANRLRGLVTGSVELSSFSDCDLVIEAVFEELAVKKQVFAELEKHIAPDCVLATNTSSLSISAMAGELAHPERVIGFHFFNPVAVLPLVEVIRGENTDDATTATALFVAKELRKNAVLVKDAPAFVVNRLLTRLMGEVTAAVDEGTPIEIADTALHPLGLPMTPFTLLQLVGPAVALHVAEVLHAAFGDRFSVSPNLRVLVGAGRVDVYDRTPDGRPYVSDETRALFTVGTTPSTADQVRDRATAALAEEIGLMLAE